MSIPVFLLSRGEAVLLDSGYAEPDRAAILELLEQRGLHVRAIIGSHSHNDHNGSHAFFQRTQGTEIILQETEAAMAASFAGLTRAYLPASEAELRRELPDLPVHADRTFSATDETVEVDGAVFRLVPLPGHTQGHTGIVTPDGVFYVGDAVMDDGMLQRTKLPTTWDWADDLASKRRLRDMKYPAYLLAHRGVYGEIAALTERNISDRLERAEQLARWLGEQGPVTLHGAERLFWEKLELHSRHFLSQIVFRRNVLCVLRYLVHTGAAETACCDGTVYDGAAPRAAGEKREAAGSLRLGGGIIEGPTGQLPFCPRL